MRRAHHHTQPLPPSLLSTTQGGIRHIAPTQEVLPLYTMAWLPREISRCEAEAVLYLNLVTTPNVYFPPPTMQRGRHMLRPTATKHGTASSFVPPLPILRKPPTEVHVPERISGAISSAPSWPNGAVDHDCRPSSPLVTYQLLSMRGPLIRSPVIISLFDSAFTNSKGS